MTAADAEVRAGAVFDALADPTRRSVLRAVAERGPLTATALAARLPISRQAISKHLGVLRTAGLVTAERAGRELRYAATPEPMIEAGRWLDATGAAWDARLDRLAARVRSQVTGRDGPPRRE